MHKKLKALAYFGMALTTLYHGSAAAMVKGADVSWLTQI